MNDDKNIEKFLRKIDVIPDAQKKRLRLEELLKTRDNNKKNKSTNSQAILWRLIMNKQIWKVAASLAVAAIVISIIGVFQNGGQNVYGFEQTLAAMKKKSSFHIRTYYGTPTWSKDEFWAEFDDNGQVIRIRQAEWLGQSYPQVQVIWENGIKYQYELDDKRKERGEPGVLLISRKENHVDKDELEEFDPEMIMERIYKQIEDGDAIIEINDSPAPDGNIFVEVTDNNNQWQKVFLVDQGTDIVLRVDTYELTNPDEENEVDELSTDGGKKYSHGIAVLEYNQPFDANIFQPNFPDDTIIIDQTSGNVGMAQGNLSDEDITQDILRQALEAWAADDYETAGKLFGGAPKELFLARASEKPIGEIVIEEPEWMPLEPNRPRYGVVCSYVVEEDGELKMKRIQYCVTTVAGQPGRWFITPIKI